MPLYIFIVLYFVFAYFCSYIFRLRAVVLESMDKVTVANCNPTQNKLLSEVQQIYKQLRSSFPHCLANEMLCNSVTFSIASKQKFRF